MGLRSAEDLFQEPLSSGHPPCFPHTDQKLPDVRQGQHILEVTLMQVAHVG